MSAAARNHSYEEIRQVVVDILSGSEQGPHVGDVNQFVALNDAVAKVFVVRETGVTANDPAVHYAKLSHQDAEYLREVFWDLFLQRVIVLGKNSANPEYPWFKVSSYGQKFLGENEGYFFHDVASYEQRIRADVPDIDALTLLYLKEAMQAFRAGCILAATVMIGVASEHEFLGLFENLEASSRWQRNFAKAAKERHLLGKFNAFRKVLETIGGDLPPKIREDLDTTLAGVLSLIRNHRNESGHPTGIIIEREQCYVLLQLFIPYCKKLHQLRKFFSTGDSK